MKTSTELPELILDGMDMAFDWTADKIDRGKEWLCDKIEWVVDRAAWTERRKAEAELLVRPTWPRPDPWLNDVRGPAGAVGPTGPVGPGAVITPNFNNLAPITRVEPVLVANTHTIPFIPGGIYSSGAGFFGSGGAFATPEEWIAARAKVDELVQEQIDLQLELSATRLEEQRRLLKSVIDQGLTEELEAEIKKIL